MLSQPTCSAKFFFGGTGIARMRCHFNPRPFRNLRTWVGLRRMPVSFSIRSHASAIVQTGASSNDARMMSRKAANSLTGFGTLECRSPSNPPLQFAVRLHVSLHCSARHPNDFRSLLASDPTVREPDCQHLVPNQEIGMARAFLIADSSLVFRKMDTTPSHRPPPCVANQK